jgi:very-short-patch-repair endonuclease
MSASSDHADRGKSWVRRDVWRVLQVQPADPDKTSQPVRICRVLQVQEAGERGLAAVAAAQRGVVARSQLLALGIGRGAVAHRVAGGSLHRVFPSVFAVGHPALAPWALETAALLYCGKDGVLSHGSAAALWGLTPPAPAVSITAVGRHPRPQRDLHVHRVPELDGRDVRIHEGLPVTAPARTLVDLAAATSAGQLERALNQARVQRLVTDAQLHEAMNRCPLRKGLGSLRAVLVAEQGPAMTRSEAERRLRRLVEQAGLPWPQFNVWLHGHLVDAVWHDAGLVAEVDGFRVHGTRGAFEADRRRDQRLIAQGFVVIRISARQLRDEPMAVAVRLAQALAVARARATRE